jgi:phenylpropionate dioxygenase-like ring-hydroxylating dioxygenase large terminal subunit
MTRIGPGTPAGKLLRRYWQPVALVDEMQAERPVKAVRLLGENLVLYRTANQYSLIQRHCPHRGADLAYGRLEADGLRCSFHGWKFDASGKCVETPAEPEGSRLCEHIKTVSYPVVEKSGILFAYLGEGGVAPAFPHFDCFVAPDAYTFAFKGYWDCNWLQALEVGIDPAHASWLHKYFEDEDTAGSYGKQFRGVPADSDLPISKVLREYDRPEIRVERADYGMRLQTLRRISEAQTHIRVTNILFPQAFVIPMNAEMTITQFHVPVDDTGCYWYSIFTSFGGAVDKDTMRSQRLRTYPAPDYKPIFSRANSWGFSADEQKSQTFTGMGFDINIHDQFACESQGLIADRTRENLGSTDKGIVLYRRLLMDAIRKNDAGELVVGTEFTGPPTIDGIGPTSGIDDYWKSADESRRKQSKWAA